MLTTHWRATGPYLSHLSSKAGLLAEIRQFLLLLPTSSELDEVRQRLVNGELPQRSRVTRQRIVEHIWRRLVRWQPPAWVLGDLVAFAQDRRSDILRSALLLHVPRQDRLLYEVVQQVIVPRWQAGEYTVGSADVQRFLDEEQVTHPEIKRWRHATREKMSRHILSLLRDYGLLRGTVRKQIIEPVVFPEVLRHVVRLLEAEGVTRTEMPHHPDWRLWLWDAERAQAAIENGKA